MGCAPAPNCTSPHRTAKTDLFSDSRQIVCTPLFSVNNIKWIACCGLERHERPLFNVWLNYVGERLMTFITCLGRFTLATCAAALLIAAFGAADAHAQKRTAQGDSVYAAEDRNNQEFLHVWPEMPADANLPESNFRVQGDDPNQLMNQPLPSLELQRFANDPADLKDKLVLIEFWHTSSAQCRGVVDRLNEIHQDFGEDLAVLAISPEASATVARFAGNRIQYSLGVDSKIRMQEHVAVKKLPHVIVVDKYGYVRWQGFPGLRNHNLTDDVIRSLIETYSGKIGD